MNYNNNIMILTADSGSTKCDWILLNVETGIITKIRTKGINPKLLNKKQIIQIIKQSPELIQLKESISKVNFYGAGCGDQKAKDGITDILKEVFPNAFINVYEDLAAAVFGTTDKHAVICIVGTGSNSCYYDGDKIHRRITSLGFLVMDDGSGNYFGKELLRAFFYKKTPSILKYKFSKSFNLNENIILENLYEKENGSGYLANYAVFLIENRSHPFIQEMIKKGVCQIFDNLINPYALELKKVPLHFVGTIAYFLQQDILQEANKRGYKVGSFVKAPIDNLISKLCSSSRTQMS
ncbi:BadF/BadG/BcrA/BcrD ATPase family protein [Flavobacterium frigoris]|nr:BadF/BadG/BcrA/BcrD ATPase family protein [Flavobacterium frigoris]